MKLYPKPESQIVRRRGRTTAALLTGALALTGCAKGHEDSSNAAKAKSTASASAENSSSTTPSPEASPNQQTSKRAPKSIGAMVCDGLFTQAVRQDGYLVVGRPAVDKQGYPLDIEVNDHGLQATSQPHAQGKIQWYDMQGKPQPASNISCKPTKIYEREITVQPRDETMWVASDSPSSKPPRHWDFAALQPDGFGGVGLDYANADNLMTSFNVGEITTQAQRAAHHPHP
jgi:hypothetical protein